MQRIFINFFFFFLASNSALARLLSSHIFSLVFRGNSHVRLICFCGSPIRMLAYWRKSSFHLQLILIKASLPARLSMTNFLFWFWHLLEFINKWKQDFFLAWEFFCVFQIARFFFAVILHWRGWGKRQLDQVSVKNFAVNFLLFLKMNFNSILVEFEDFYNDFKFFY